MPRRYVPKYRRKLGVVFQDFRLLRDRNVFENVAFAQRVVGASTRSIRESVPEMLKLVGFFKIQVPASATLGRRTAEGSDCTRADQPPGSPACG
ncbi:MAG: hypothetical protein V8S27_02595 [Lachnospiraceae bacterium]